MVNVITVLSVVVLLVLQYCLWVGNGSFTEAHHLELEITRLTQEIDQLTKYNDTEIAEVRDLKHGYEAVEEYARTELGMIGQDETFYRIIGNSLDK